MEVQILMHTQPVEKLHEILKALLRNYFCNKDEQPANAGVKDSNSHSMNLADGQSDEEILSSYYGPKNIRKGENREHDFSPKDERMIKSSSSNSEDKARCYVETIKLQPADVGVSNSVPGSSEHPVGNSDSIIVSEEVEERNYISKDDVIVGSSLKSVVKKTDPSKKVKLANPTVKDLGLNATRHTTADSNEMKILCNSNIEVSGNEEHCSRATGKSKILSSSLNPEGKGNHPRKDKFAGTVVKNINAKELRCATGIHVRKGNADSGLGTCSNTEIEQKLSDFSKEAAPKQTMKESKAAASQNVVSLNSPLKTQGKKKSPPQIVKVVEAALTETENCALTSLLELQDKKGISAIKLLLKEGGKGMPEVNTSEICPDEENFHLDLSHSFHKEKAKMSIKLSTPIIQEIGFSTMVVDSSSSLVSEGKKHKKSGLGPLTARLNQDHRTKKVVLQLAECKLKENGSSLGDGEKSVSQPQKKRKRSTNFPIIAEAKDFTIQVDFSDSQIYTTNSNEDNQSVTDSCSIHDSSSVTLPSMPSASILEKMKLADLRDIAKRCKLTKYYKLSKKELLQLLASKIGTC
ncbi:uncharacterized protein LOC110621295 isoform X3 [Manihot esculenta]|nr:uncharacterized protein LOC110621295 isoform X3 [Manihot esculenta]